MVLRSIEFCTACGQPLRATTRTCSGCGKLARRVNLTAKMWQSEKTMRMLHTLPAPSISFVDPDTDWTALGILVITILMIAVLVAGKAGML
jgi:hypothetical protein